MSVEVELPAATGGIAWVPTPEEIAQGAAEIRKEWTPAERRQRWCYKPKEWLPPGAERVKSPADLARDEMKARGKGFSENGKPAGFAKSAQASPDSPTETRVYAVS